MTFRLSSRTARAASEVAETTPASTRLVVSLDPPLPADRPFAALRSMFVTPARADVAVAAWPGEERRADTRIQQDKRASARFGRIQESRHNLSAPDLVFDEFATRRALSSP
jgi:hypothetical protein